MLDSEIDMKSFNEKELKENRRTTGKKVQSFDRLGFFFSGSFILSFVFLSIYDRHLLSWFVSQGFFWSTKFFGLYWQILLTAAFFIGLFLAFGRTGNVVLGNLSKPDVGVIRWVAIIAATLLGGGGVFWAITEPIVHYVDPPPFYGSETSMHQRAINALSQSFLHWGFPAWSIVSGIVAIVFMYLHYDKGLPLKPRLLLYPVLGDRVLKGSIGSLIDAFCILSAVSGTIGPIGFLGLQVSHGLSTLFGYSDLFSCQLLIIFFAVTIYTVSAMSGLTQGLQVLSNCNAILVFLLMLYILAVGPTSFIFDAYVQSLGCMLSNFLSMSTYRGDKFWLSQWTLFFWGWFIGFSPLMGILVARISRGRSIRQLIFTLTVFAPLATCFWIAVLGGLGLSSELSEPGSISTVVDKANIQNILLEVASKLPLPLFSSISFLILATVFILTMGDSITYTIGMVLGNTKNPNKWIRVFWGIMIGLLALILISFGSGGISALQSFIVITAVPVSLILLPSLWKVTQISIRMASNQALQKKI